MSRRTYKARICRLLGTVSPLTIAQIQAALDDPGAELGVSRNTAANLVGGLRRFGVLRAVSPSPRQRMRELGPRARSVLRAWELVP